MQYKTCMTVFIKMKYLSYVTQMYTLKSLINVKICNIKFYSALNFRDINQFMYNLVSNRILHKCKMAQNV